MSSQIELSEIQCLQNSRADQQVAPVAQKRPTRKARFAHVVHHKPSTSPKRYHTWEKEKENGGFIQ